MANQRGASPAAPGPGVDSSGNPVFDPTANVYALVEAAVERLNDLRASDLEHIEQLRDELKQHYDRVLAEREKRYDERFESVKEAVVKAETAADRRFDSVNEFRTTLSDQTATFITRAEFTAHVNALTEKIEAVNRTTHDKIDDLRVSRDMTVGRSKGVEWSAGALVTVISVVGILLGIVATVVAIIATG